MHQGQRIRLITIDLDDTVWPCAPVIQDAEEVLYAWLAERAPRLTAVHDPASLRSHRFALMQERPEIAHDVTAVRLFALRALMDQYGYQQQLADDAMVLFQQCRNRVTPYADVRTALARLRERYRLVSVTNGNAQVHHTALRDSFDRSLTAAEAGAAKPDPALFKLAMDWAGVGVDETLHIGDDPLRDVEAARSHGLRAVWVNRDGLPWPEELAPPEFEVRDLHALAHWLDGRKDTESADEV
jgi:FMN hydrolase / 5-amino-6-(5-phospho-D-ribitylamino)uracil phosphatase